MPLVTEPVVLIAGWFPEFVLLALHFLCQDCDCLSNSSVHMLRRCWDDAILSVS